MPFLHNRYHLQRKLPPLLRTGWFPTRALQCLVILLAATVLAPTHHLLSGFFGVSAALAAPTPTTTAEAEAAKDPASPPWLSLPQTAWSQIAGYASQKDCFSLLQVCKSFQTLLSDPRQIAEMRENAKHHPFCGFGPLMPFPDFLRLQTRMILPHLHLAIRSEQELANLLGSPHARHLTHLQIEVGGLPADYQPLSAVSFRAGKNLTSLEMLSFKAHFTEHGNDPTNDHGNPPRVASRPYRVHGGSLPLVFSWFPNVRTISLAGFYQRDSFDPSDRSAQCVFLFSFFTVASFAEALERDHLSQLDGAKEFNFSDNQVADQELLTSVALTPQLYRPQILAIWQEIRNRLSKVIPATITEERLQQLADFFAQPAGALSAADRALAQETLSAVLQASPFALKLNLSRNQLTGSFFRHLLYPNLSFITELDLTENPFQPQFLPFIPRLCPRIRMVRLSHLRHPPTGASDPVGAIDKLQEMKLKREFDLPGDERSIIFQ